VRPFKMNMPRSIDVKTLRRELARILRLAGMGERFTVLYRGRPVCMIVPIEEAPQEPGDLDDETLYRAGPLGRSTDGGASRHHDETLYGTRP